MHIRDIHNPWRDALLPASFKNVEFHVESASEDNGRRIVVHEFPKKESPYAEDMGRRAFGYMVRGYCISYMVDTDIQLYQRDYRVPRDLLRDALDSGGYGWLQLPTMQPVRVVCDRYRLTEETRFGGSLSKVQSVDQRMRLECGVGFRQLRTCRRTRPGSYVPANRRNRGRKPL